MPDQNAGGPGVYTPDDLAQMEEMMGQMGGGDEDFDPMGGMGGMDGMGGMGGMEF